MRIVAKGPAECTVCVPKRHPAKRTAEANDCTQLWAAVDRLEQRLNRKPQQLVADRGYASRENIEKMTAATARFSGEHAVCTTWSQPAEPATTERDSCVCPEGRILTRQRQRKVGHGLTYHVYEARFDDCRTCSRKPECCPNNKNHGRSVVQLEESPLVISFRRKMSSEAAQQRYRRPGKNSGILSRMD